MRPFGWCSATEITACSAGPGGLAFPVGHPWPGPQERTGAAGLEVRSASCCRPLMWAPPPRCGPLCPFQSVTAWGVGPPGKGVLLEILVTRKITTQRPLSAPPFLMVYTKCARHPGFYPLPRTGLRGEFLRSALASLYPSCTPPAPLPSRPGQRLTSCRIWLMALF